MGDRSGFHSIELLSLIRGGSGLEFLLPVLLSAVTVRIIAVALVFESSVYQPVILSCMLVLLSLPSGSLRDCCYRPCCEASASYSEQWMLIMLDSV
jgi:hypothetical protein